MSLAKSRKCAETCLDLLQIELVNYYSEQHITPPQAAIDAIGKAPLISPCSSSSAWQSPAGFALFVLIKHPADTSWICSVRDAQAVGHLAGVLCMLKALSAMR